MPRAVVLSARFDPPRCTQPVIAHLSPSAVALPAITFADHGIAPVVDVAHD